MKSTNECFDLKDFLFFFTLFLIVFAFFRYWNLYAYSNCTTIGLSTCLWIFFKRPYPMRWNELQPKYFSCDAIIRWLRRHFLKRLLLLQVSAVLICSGQILTLTHRPRWDAKYPFGKTPLTYCRCPKLKITVVRKKNCHVIRGKWKTNMLLHFYTD